MVRVRFKISRDTELVFDIGASNREWGRGHDQLRCRGRVWGDTVTKGHTRKASPKHEVEYSWDDY